MKRYVILPVVFAPLVLAAVVMFGGCGGVDVKQVASQNPEAALPSGPSLVIGVDLKSVAENPLIGRLRAILSAGGGEFPLRGAFAGLGIPNPGAQVEAAAWAAYETQPGNVWKLTPLGPMGGAAMSPGLWALVIRGEIDETGALAGLESPTNPASGHVERSDYMRVPLVTVSGLGADKLGKRYIAFPSANFLFASNSQTLMQKMLAVWQGRADGLMTDEGFAPLLHEAQTTAPFWMVGKGAGVLTGLKVTSGQSLSRGDSLGVGVDWFRGGLTLSEDAVNLSGVFRCENNDLATQQAANYEVLIKQGSLLSQFASDSLALVAMKEVQVRAAESDVVMEASLNTEKLDAIEKEIKEARERSRDIMDAINRRGSSMTPEELQQILIDSGAIKPVETPDSPETPASPEALAPDATQDSPLNMTPRESRLNFPPEEAPAAGTPADGAPAAP